ncbi:MAG: hypothetical protein GF309_13905 [Candidatus Lokiarchaeota archaeon]|nr:hypothetical protein [Candidatus Lokiarchaeota archaeon]
MSQKDLFSKYSDIYRKAEDREIVPDGPFVRQFIDIPHDEIDVGVFFKSKNSKQPVQVHIGNAIPMEYGSREGLIQTDQGTLFSRKIVSDIRDIEFVKAIMYTENVLESRNQKMRFLQKCQRIIDVLVRKAKNVIHIGAINGFRMDKRVFLLREFLGEQLGMNEVSIEAASIPFDAADPDCIILSDNTILTLTQPRVAHAVFHFVGGLGYTFDKAEGAIQEERLFRSTVDLSDKGIDQAYIDGIIERMTEDFQNNVHALMFADTWKKSEEKPAGVIFDKNLLIKMGTSSEIWTGVFEVYVRPPSSS